MLSISSQFDSGAIDVLSCQRAEAIRLKIRCDTGSEFLQWFHFRLSGANGQACTISFANAGETSYPGGWRDYQVAASYDGDTWFRVPTTYDEAVMTVRFTPARDTVYFAYFEPYSWERHLKLLGRIEASGQARVERLGTTLQERDLDMIVCGNTAAARNIWVIARQHPGETMAEWFVEGLAERLLDASDPVGRSLLRQAAFYIVPNMNPDGSVLGNLRTNAAGANLNREWMEPSLDRSPEVWHVKKAIQSHSPGMFFDIHGDEQIPYNFVSGCEMLPGISDAQKAMQRRFVNDFKRASPDFQDQHGYGAGRYSQDALKLASKFVGHTYGCLSLTLEMPFKDNAGLPDPAVGWNGARSKALGAAMLLPILQTLLPSSGA